MVTEQFYEIYPKRAIHEGILKLTVMDRGWNYANMRTSARSWGACVVKVTAIVHSRRPFTRTITGWKILFVHNPRRVVREARDMITIDALKWKMGKLKGRTYTRRR